MDLSRVTEPAERWDELVARARQGDASALEALARSHLPIVERMLYRILGPRKDMEDLVQTVFLELCRVLPRFRGESSFSTFLGGITVTVARRAMRPTAFQRRRGEMPDEVSAREDSPEAAATARARMRSVQKAIASLSDAHRIAFTLWAFEGIDPATIATMTGATVSATRSRIFYAQKYLKEAASRDAWLAEWLGGGDDESR